MNNNEPQVSFYLPALGNVMMTSSPEDAYSKYEMDYQHCFSLTPEPSHWMSINRDFSEEIERRKRTMRASSEASQNTSQKSIWSRLFD
jgi:hypothetical protein